MLQLTVLYGGKRYEYNGTSSIDLNTILVREFGKIVGHKANEAGTLYQTSKGAEAYMCFI